MNKVRSSTHLMKVVKFDQIRDILSRNHYERERYRKQLKNRGSLNNRGSLDAHARARVDVDAESACTRAAAGKFDAMGAA